MAGPVRRAAVARASSAPRSGRPASATVSTASRPAGRSAAPSVPASVSASSSGAAGSIRSEEHTSELQSLAYLVCRLLLEKKKRNNLQALVVHIPRPRRLCPNQLHWRRTDLRDVHLLAVHSARQRQCRLS